MSNKGRRGEEKKGRKNKIHSNSCKKMCLWKGVITESELYSIKITEFLWRCILRVLFGQLFPILLVAHGLFVKKGSTK